MKQHLFAISLFTLTAIFGCKTTTIETMPSVIIPNVGSSWMLKNVHRDSTGNIAKTDTSTRVVAATNLNYAGYSDVVMTVETNLRTNISDTIYLRYLPTGDISRSSSPQIDSLLQHWFTIPYQSKGSQSASFGGASSAPGYTHDSVSFTASYLGTESDTVQGVIYPAVVINSTTWQHATSSSKDSMSLITQTNSFIPSKGIFANHIVTLNQVNGRKLNRNEQTLIAVSLK